MQNADGGFGAFAKGITEHTLVKVAAGKFVDSAELFDPSSVDVTAHVLEAWGLMGYTKEHEHV